jgi:hypothetical protein
MSSAIQALSWQKIRYTSRNVTDADHAEPNRADITPGQRRGRVSSTHRVVMTSTVVTLGQRWITGQPAQTCTASAQRICSWR